MGRNNNLIISFTSLVLSSMLSIAIFVAFVVRQYHYNIEDTIIMGYVYYFPFVFFVFLISREIFKRIGIFRRITNKIAVKNLTLGLSLIAVVIYSLLPITTVIPDSYILYLDLFIIYIVGMIVCFNLLSLFTRINSW